MPGTPTAKYGIQTMNGAADPGSSIDDTHNAAMATIDSKMVGYSAGLLAARPVSTGGSPGITGRRYRATDTSQEFIDTGTSWIEIAQAPVPDSKLASPNNSVWRTLFAAHGALSGSAAGRYTFGPSGLIVASGSTTYLSGSNGGMQMVPLVASDYAVAGKTTELRMIMSIATNATPPGTTFAGGLYTVTLGGGSDVLTVTSAASPTGNAASIATPAAASLVQAASAAFGFPSNGVYVPGVSVAGNIALASVVAIKMALQIRHV